MKKIVTGIVALTATTALMAGVNAGACTGCHGADWSKAALGKSKNVSQMAHADIAAALKGYKDGSYGGPMKGLMKGQVANLSSDDIKALSAHIVSLKK